MMMMMSVTEYYPRLTWVLLYSLHLPDPGSSLLAPSTTVTRGSAIGNTSPML